MTKKRPLRIAMAQINPTVGDLAGNYELIFRRVREAHEKKADMVIFSEMALSGYPIWDLANKVGFVEEGKAAIRRLMKACLYLHPAVVLGFVDREPGKKKSFNALAVLYRGKCIHLQYKTLLPTYDVFLEHVFFLPGEKTNVFTFKGWTIGASICEDLWDDDYREKPTARLKELGAELVINISASPFYRGVGKVRDALIRRKARANRVPIVYVNQVGAQDDLIFDGRSMAADEKGRMLFRAPAFSEGLFSVRLPSREAPRRLAPPEDGIDMVYQALVLGIRDYCRKNNFTRVVIGLSGGIDSALTATLAADALGPEHVLGVTMPGPFSSEGSVSDSEQLASHLGFEIREMSIVPMYELGLTERGPVEKSAITPSDENFQARLRAIKLMYISNSEGRLLLTTGNKSELAVGYCTLYGDMCGGLSVLGDVYKTDVYRLAEYRNSIDRVIPRASITKAPSAELRPNQKDEDSLPPYSVLDRILHAYIEENKSRVEIEKKMKGRAAKEVIASILALVDHNEYKRRQTPPTLRVSSKAWFGRRMPITNRYRG